MPLWAQQRLDGTALVHGAVAFRHLVQRQCQVKDLAGIDLPAPHTVDQLGQKPAHRSRAAAERLERDALAVRRMVAQLDRLRYVYLPTDDIWVRDYGPLIGFNPAFLNDALRVIPFDEVQIEMHEAFRPGVLSGEDQSEFLYVIMPVSLSS